MFTSIDKALVAVIMGAIAILNQGFHFNIGVSEATVNILATVLTPILVYLVPNKKPQ